MKLDLLVRNARILTADGRRPRATSLGIWNGRITGVDDDLDGHTASAVIDLDGATVAPGFHDAHCHTTSFGMGLVHLELGELHGIDATLGAVASYAAGLEPEEWVIGFGFGNGLPPDQYPHREELDRAGGGRAVWLTHLSGHSCVVSSAVLDAVGISGALGQGGRGEVVVDSAGRPTGLLLEAAMDVVKNHVGPSSIEQLAAAIDRATSQYLAEGITSFTDAGIGCPGIDHSPVELAAYQLARETGRLRARAHLMAHDQLFHPLAGHRDDRIVSGLDLGVRTGFGDPWLSLGAMKIWVDGSGLGGTAATTGPGGEIGGGFDDDPAVLRRSIIDAHRAGWQVAAHAIGDAALDLVLDALEEASDGEPFPARAGVSPRHRIEHGVMIRDDQVGRLARMGMSVVLQPLFLTDFGDTLLDLLSQHGDLGSFFFRMRSLVAAGIPVVGSSDRPVAAGSPLRGIQAMVERTTSDGNVFGPDERLSPSEALEFYTVGGARATHAEHDVGVIAARRLADLVVLGDDPTTVDPGRIGAIDVVATLVGGQAVHDPSALFAGAPPPAGAGAGPTGPDGHA